MTDAAESRTAQPRLALEVHFVGEDLHPETVPLSSLSKALSAIHRLASGPRQAGDEAGDDDVGPFQLLQVKRGSAIYAFAGHHPGVAHGRLRLAGQAIDRPEEATEVDAILSPIEDLSQIASHLKCAIVLKEPRPRGTVLARIEPDSFKRISHSLLVRGETAIAGVVKRVGGATRLRCSLRVATRRELLYCKVASSKVARQLGKYLYQDVVVRGTATWVKTTWRLIGFEIRSATQHRPDNLLDTMQALYEAGGRGWDDAEDPEALLRRVRGD